jgi:microcystin-dependent protein
MDEAYIGSIVLFAGNFAPQGWLFCQGQTLPIAQYQALYSILGTTYGGNGSVNFQLPDLRTRVPVGVGQGPGLPNVSLGQMSGTAAVTLTQDQIPAHTHATTVSINAGADTNLSNIATGRALSSDAKGGGIPPLMYTDSAIVPANVLKAGSATAVVANTGGSKPHDNMQPYLGLNYIICVNGIYPQRP